MKSIPEKKFSFAYEACLSRALLISCCQHEKPETHKRAVESALIPGIPTTVCQNRGIFLMNISKLPSARTGQFRGWKELWTARVTGKKADIYIYLSYIWYTIYTYIYVKALWVCLMLKSREHSCLDPSGDSLLVFYSSVSPYQSILNRASAICLKYEHDHVTSLCPSLQDKNCH